MKVYYLTCNVGRCKYMVNFHDGEKCHGDGSPFYDIEIFSDKKRRDAFVNRLKREGYRER